jgi:hypothetical protein
MNFRALFAALGFDDLAAAEDHVAAVFHQLHDLKS